MSTQDASGLDFSILPEGQQQHFRLLELPPELLELLTAANAPTYGKPLLRSMTTAKQRCSFQLKSRENVPGGVGEQSAVLCTPDKTYNIRQVNSSNSLFVTHLSNGPGEELPKPRLEAIAQSNFTLELQAANDVSAASHIQALLPVYASTGHYPSKNPISKAMLFSNVPASDAECEQAWTDLACFETDGESLIPSASVRAQVWERISSAATAERVDLTAPLLEQHTSTLVDLNSGSQWPREVSLAVLRSMARSGEAGGLLLDEKKSARSIGQALLQDRAERTAIPKASFVATWADLLPEKWRGSADLALLEGSYKIEDGGIQFNDEEGDGVLATPGAKAPAEAKSALGAKRKWHEKFRATKKAA